MSRRTSIAEECCDSDDDDYSGYNLCAALNTADIEEYGIGVLCRSSEDSRPSTDTPSVPFPTQQQLVKRREAFRGFKLKTEPRWMKTPRGLVPRPTTAKWGTETPPTTGHMSQSGTDFYMRTASVELPLGMTSRPRTDCETMTGTAVSRSVDSVDFRLGTTPRPRTDCETRTGTAVSRSVDSVDFRLGMTPRPRTDCKRRTGTAVSRSVDSLVSPSVTNSRPGTEYGSRVGTAISYRPETPDHRCRYSCRDTPRPLSRIRAANYIPRTRGSNTSARQRIGSDPKQLAANRHSEPFSEEWVKSPLEEMLLLQKQICQLFLECRQTQKPDSAISMALDAQEKEQRLNFIFANVITLFPYNTSLTFAVIMNLASQYEANKMYKQALETYKIISTSKLGVFELPLRAKINIGNMYEKLGQYSMAVKLYHMALDQVPRKFNSFRAKILRNLGVVFFKTNQLVNAISAFTTIMEEKPTFTDGLNLMACLYALDSKNDMKTCFEMLLVTPPQYDKDGDKYSTWDVERNAELKCLKDGFKFDDLGKLESKMKLEAEKTILMSANLVAKSICDTIFDGYDWCIETMKHSQFAHLVGEIQITKATKLMNENQLISAIELLGELQRNSETAKCAAATNLAFIYLTQKDADEAERYSSIACEADCYSSSAMVNSGCCLLAREEDAQAKARFTSAVENDALCFEALYDLGLVNKKMGLYVEAICCFSKLHAIFRDDTCVLYQLALLQEMTGDVDKAMVRYQQILCLEPRNALILKQVGKLFDQTGDTIQAHQYYLDSYRVMPSDVDVLIWLAIYNLNMGCPEEKAIEYINRAIQCQPHQVKWQLMVASCHQRSGNLIKATECYEEIHRQFPENIECLRCLVKIYMPSNEEKAKEHAFELKKLEKKMVVVHRRLSTPSNRSICSQLSIRSSPERQSQAATPHEMSPNLSPSVCDTLDCHSPNMLGDECYSRPLSGRIVRRHQPPAQMTEEELYAVQRNTIATTSQSQPNGQMFSRNESKQSMCKCDDECGINSVELFDTKCQPCMRYYPCSNESLEVKCPSISNRLPFQRLYMQKLSTRSESEQHHISVLPMKGDVYQFLQDRERPPLQCAASDPICSTSRCVDDKSREYRGYLPLTPRMVFTNVAGPVGVAQFSMCMSDGDSRVNLHDELQGQRRYSAVRTSARSSARECNDDLGLRIFADSELGADLLPN